MLSRKQLDPYPTPNEIQISTITHLIQFNGLFNLKRLFFELNVVNDNELGIYKLILYQRIDNLATKKKKLNQSSFQSETVQAPIEVVPEQPIIITPAQQQHTETQSIADEEEEESEEEEQPEEDVLSSNKKKKKKVINVWTKSNSHDILKTVQSSYFQNQLSAKWNLKDEKTGKVNTIHSMIFSNGKIKSAGLKSNLQLTANITTFLQYLTQQRQTLHRDCIITPCIIQSPFSLQHTYEKLKLSSFEHDDCEGIYDIKYYQYATEQCSYSTSVAPRPMKPLSAVATYPALETEIEGTVEPVEIEHPLVCKDQGYRSMYELLNYNNIENDLEEDIDNSFPQHPNLLKQTTGLRMNRHKKKNRLFCVYHRHQENPPRGVQFQETTYEFKDGNFTDKIVLYWRFRDDDNTMRHGMTLLFSNGELRPYDFQNENAKLVDYMKHTLYKRRKTFQCLTKFGSHFEPLQCMRESICMINTDFDSKITILRDELYKILKKQCHIACSFEPDIYPAVKLRYAWNYQYKQLPTTYQEGRCYCTKRCNGKSKHSKHSYGNGNCKIITVCIFNSGKIIITGAKQLDQIYDAYAFVNNVLKTHYEQIAYTEFELSMFTEINTEEEVKKIHANAVATALTQSQPLPQPQQVVLAQSVPIITYLGHPPPPSSLHNATTHKKIILFGKPR